MNGYRQSCIIFLGVLLLYAAAVPAESSPQADLGSHFWDVRDFGAVGDEKTDDTAAFQKALNAAGEAGGGVVYASRGSYFFAGHLNIPKAVALVGLWQSVPAHNGIRDRGSGKPTDDGTTFLVTEGAGNEEDTAFITLNTNSTLKGVVIYYPQQNVDDVPKPYPWAIAMRGKNPAVLAVEMLNPYNGIDATQSDSEDCRGGHRWFRGLYVCPSKGTKAQRHKVAVARSQESEF